MKLAGLLRRATEPHTSIAWLPLPDPGREFEETVRCKKITKLAKSNMADHTVETSNQELDRNF
jgi:hypothetical protein